MPSETLKVFSLGEEPFTLRDNPEEPERKCTCGMYGAEFCVRGVYVCHSCAPSDPQDSLDPVEEDEWARILSHEKEAAHAV